MCVKPEGSGLRLVFTILIYNLNFLEYHLCCVLCTKRSVKTGIFCDSTLHFIANEVYSELIPIDFRRLLAIMGRFQHFAVTRARVRIPGKSRTNIHLLDRIYTRALQSLIMLERLLFVCQFIF